MSLFDKLILKESKLADFKYHTQARPEEVFETPTTIRKAAKENGERVSKFLSTSRGTFFEQNQNQLNRHNAKTESALGLPRISPFYIPINTINQAGDPQIGAHIPRNSGDGLLPYSEIAKQNNTLKDNRLSKLYNKLQVGHQKDAAVFQFQQTVFDQVNNALGLGEIQGFFNNVRGLFNSITSFSNAQRDLKGVARRSGLNSINNAVTSATNFINTAVTDIKQIASRFSPEEGQIDSYINGPSGNPVTEIRRFDYTNNQNKVATILALGKDVVKFDRDTHQSRVLLTSRTLPITSAFPDAGKAINTNVKEIKNDVYAKATNYTELNNLNKPTTHTEFNKNSYTYTTKVNPSSKTKSGNNVNWLRSRGVENGKIDAFNDTTINDRMPIIFKLIDPFNPAKIDELKFSAYISGFTDTSSPTWNEISYIGRSENFYVYNKFSRDVSFQLKIPVFNINELKAKHELLAKLVASTMGKYNANKLGGMLSRLTLGNYLNDITGIIQNVTYTIPDDSPWDVDNKLAQNIFVNISFRVIHDFLPNYNNADKIFNIKDIKPNLNNSNPVKDILTAKSSPLSPISTDLSQNYQNYIKKLIK